MTKEQFLSGVSFKVAGSDYVGASTFKYHSEYIMKQSRSSTDDGVLFQSHHCNVTEIINTGFKGFVYLMSKLVKVSYKFKDLIEFDS